MSHIIRQMIDEWYGMRMPAVFVTVEQDIEEYQAEYPEVPQEFWTHFSHATRLMSKWIRDADMDFVVWNEESKSYRLVQDVCFRDSYPSDSDWHKAVQAMIADPSRKCLIVTYAC